MKRTILSVLRTSGAAVLTAGILLASGCAAQTTSVALATPAPETPAAVQETVSASAAPTQTPEATSPYDEVLAQYADAVKNNFYQDKDESVRDSSFGEYVALELRVTPQQLYYALDDLNGDGVQELFIGAEQEDTTPAYYDVLDIQNGKAVRLFDFDFGYRTIFTPFADGTIEVCWSDSAFESGFDFYTIKDGAAEGQHSLLITSDPQDAEKIIYKSDETEITEEEYLALLDSYESAGVRTPEWLPITGNE